MLQLDILISHYPRQMNQTSACCTVSGAHVPGSFDEFGDLIAAVYQVLVKVCQPVVM